MKIASGGETLLGNTLGLTSLLLQHAVQCRLAVHSAR